MPDQLAFVRQTNFRPGGAAGAAVPKDLPQQVEAVYKDPGGVLRLRKLDVVVIPDGEPMPAPDDAVTWGDVRRWRPA